MNFYACSVCFLGIKDDPANVSLRTAILVMLAVLVVVLGLLAQFFLNVRKRSKLMVQ